MGLRRRWWRTTFGLVALVACGFALATLAIGAVAFEMTHEALEQQLDHRIAAETAALLHEGNDGPIGIATAIHRREAARSTGSLEYRLIDPTGRTVAGRLDAAVPRLPGYVELLPYRREGEDRIAQSLTTKFYDGHRLLVAADRAVIDEMDATLLRLFLGALGAMLLLGTGAAWLVGAVTRRRLARMDRAALAIIEGDLTRRMPVTGTDDEFDAVALTLNRMLDRIGGLMDNLRQVSSDIAHDLRTPLTRLNHQLEEAIASEDEAVRRAAIDAATAESRELLEIFAALLRIAEIEAMPPRAHFVDVPLSDVVEAIVETYRPDMEANSHILSTAIEPDIVVDGDRRLLQQLLTNLLDNVLIHTPAGTRVEIALRHNPNAELIVADDGPGVAQRDRPNLFRRFVRGEHSRSTSGHGLGLALVAAIAEAHGGGARLVGDDGFRVVIAFPRQ